MRFPKHNASYLDLPPSLALLRLQHLLKCGFRLLQGELLHRTFPLRQHSAAVGVHQLRPYKLCSQVRVLHMPLQLQLRAVLPLSLRLFVFYPFALQEDTALSHCLFCAHLCLQVLQALCKSVHRQEFLLPSLHTKAEFRVRYNHAELFQVRLQN